MDKSFNLSAQQRTEQRAEQRLTPLQMRYVRMLEMGAVQVEEEVRRALDELPALEANSETSETSELSESSDFSDNSDFSETAEQLQLADYGNPDEVPAYMLRGGNFSSGDASEKEPPWQSAAQAETLYDAVMEQLAQQGLTDQEMLAARYIVGNIDDNGYMTRSLAAIVDDMTMGEGRSFPLELLREVFERVRSVDPAGVGAYDLRDCLVLQLRRKKEAADADVATALEMVSHYFDLFSLRHFDSIASAMGKSRHEIDRAAQVVSRLQPKPGAQFAGSELEEAAQRIVPDFLVEADADERLTLTLLHNIPALRVAQSFAEDTPLPDASASRKEAARRFLNQRRTEAADFIKVLSMRQRTLMRVMSAVMQLQRRFFLTDDTAALRPMILRDVAEATGYDVSTVSRAMQGKYVATRVGVYPVKMLFGERSEQVPEDEDATMLRVSQRVGELIKEEDPRHPLTDDALTRQLLSEGFNIARRTVAKYRERLGVPVARLRKRE